MRIFIFPEGFKYSTKSIKNIVHGMSENSTYLCLDQKKQDLVNTLEVMQLNKFKLPCLSKEESENILKDYVDLIGRIS